MGGTHPTGVPSCFFCDAIFDNYFLRFKAVCSHDATAICINTYSGVGSMATRTLE